MARILVVEDDKQLGDFMLMLIEGMGHEVELATSGTAALELLERFRHDVVFTDVHMEPMSGLQFVDKVKDRYPNSVFVFFSGDSSPELQAQGMRRGALEFLHKPIRVEQLKHVLRRALSRAERERTVVAAAAAPTPPVVATSRQNAASLDLELETFYPGTPFAGIRRKLALLATGSRYGLIEVAPGMLNEELLRFLHGASPSENLPLVLRDAAVEPVSCLEDVLLPTNQGTLVLQNIEDVPVDVQIGLTKEMQDARKMRLIVTTRHDPDGLMVEGKLAGALYTRLSLAAVKLGPLADGDFDVVEVFRAAARQTPFYPFGSTMVEVDEEAARALRAHRWPENLAELWAAAGRTIALLKEPKVTAADLPDHVRGARLPSLAHALRQFETDHVSRVVRVMGGAAPAADVLGVTSEELEAYQNRQATDSFFVLKRDLTTPIPVPTIEPDRVLIVAADELVRQTAGALLASRGVEVTTVADGLAAVATIVTAPRRFSAAVLISPLTAFEPQELGLELARLTPTTSLGLMGGRAPDADPAPFAAVVPSFRTAEDIEAILHTLLHSMVERPAA